MKENARIRLMTHNIWNYDRNAPAWEENGQDCSAQARVGGLLRVYRETMPDIVGCQEASALMADLLKRGFEAEAVPYTMIWGRFTPIFYRSDKFELIDSEFGTYPEYIEEYEGKFNDQLSKSWNLGVFRIKENGKVFLFATTHLWWKKSPPDASTVGHDYQAYSDEARSYQLAILRKKVEHYRAKHNCPAIVVGDMNTGYDSKAIQDILACGFRHARYIATEYADTSVGYHFCFPSGFKTEYYDKPFEWAIDHILVFGEKEGSVKRFARYSPDYYFPISDHSPAYVDMEL